MGNFQEDVMPAFSPWDLRSASTGRQVPVTVTVVTMMMSASRQWMASTAP